MNRFESSPLGSVTLQIPGNIAATVLPGNKLLRTDTICHT